MHSLLILLVIISVVSSSYAAALTMQDLSTHLMAKHNPKACPSSKITVNLGAAVYQVVNVDGAHQEFTALMWMRFRWKDSTLSWDKNTYNFSNVWLQSDSVWKPDMVVYNIMEFEALIKSTTSYVKITSEGEVRQGFPIIYTVSCGIQISRFPFDHQICKMKLGSWMFDASRVDLLPMSDKLETSSLVANNQWELERTEVTRHRSSFDEDPPNPPAVYVDVQFVFYLRRLPMFYVFTLVIPSFIITAVALFGIFTPTQSDGTRVEKVTMGLTTMLTMAVFLLMVSDQTPKDSTNVPLLSISLYIMLDIGVVTLGTVTSVILMNLHVRDLNETPVPMIWEKFVCKVSKRTRNRVAKKRNGKVSKPTNIHKVQPVDDSKLFDDETSHMKEPSADPKKSVLLWEEVCVVLDNIALYFHFALFFFITFIMLIVLPAVYA